MPIIALAVDLLDNPLLPAVVVGGAIRAATGEVTSDKKIDLGK